MSRILLQYLLPLLLPTVLWLLWYFAFGCRRAATQGIPSRLEHGPWFWLILGGVVLLAASLGYTALTVGLDPTAGSYVAPHVEDGRIVPGGLK